MPRLFEPVRNATIGATAPGVQVNPNARNAEFQAQANIGRAVSQIGGMIDAYEQRKQDHINEGILADQEAKRIDLESQIQQYMDQNPDDIRSWGLERQRMLEGYKELREKDLENAGPDVKNLDKLRMQQWEAQSAARFRVVQNKALISKANAQIEGLAQLKLRQGDHEGFLQEMEKLDATPEQKEQKIRRGLEEGLYNMGEIELYSLPEDEDLINEYIENLTATDKDGNYLNMEVEGRGGISWGGRTQLEKMAKARIRTIHRNQTSTAVKLSRDLEKGDAGELDIDNAIFNKEISKDDGEALKTVIKAQTEFEKFTETDAYGDKTEYKAIKDDMAPWMVLAWTGQVRQPYDGKYKEILDSIVTSDLTRDSKIQLMNDYFDLKASDLSDMQEEGTGWIFDRDITPPEQEMRTNLIETYRELLPRYGALSVGQMSMNHEKMIRQFFDNNPKATYEDVQAFLKDKITNPMILELMAGASESTIDLSR